MPRGDGTGPAGAGRMTGRGAGYCAGYDVPGFANAAPGGRFFGRGGGRGYRNRYYANGIPGRAGRPRMAPDAPFSREGELDVLRQRSQSLASELNEISERIEALGQEG